MVQRWCSDGAAPAIDAVLEVTALIVVGAVVVQWDTDDHAWCRDGAVMAR